MTVSWGGSQGSFGIKEGDYAIFSGNVSLENNGGFTSLRYVPDSPIKINAKSVIVLRVKGDGKPYQLRVKNYSSDKYSYVGHFETTGEWETITVKLSEMYPSFHGKTLDMPNFSGDFIGELGFLIANKRAEEFQLLIERIDLR